MTIPYADEATSEEFLADEKESEERREVFEDITRLQGGLDTTPWLPALAKRQVG